MLRVELFPAFLRLVTQVCKSGADVSVVRQLIVHCDDIPEEEESALFKKTVASLLNVRNDKGHELMEPILESILLAAQDLLDNESTQEESENAEVPQSIAELWSKASGSMTSSLSATFANKQASFKFAEKIVKSLSQEGDDSRSPVALFYAKCLLWLCDHTSGRGKWDVKAVVRSIPVDRFDKEGAVREMLDDVMDTVA